MTRAVFLDRDGVINEVLSARVKFVNTPEQFYLLSGVGEAIKQLNDLGWKVFVVTNQGGIGLRYMTHSDLEAIHQKMEQDLAAYEAKIDAIAYCPHRPKAGCPCRKPKPNMILDLAKKHHIDLTESYMVGDRAPDIEAGKQAGVQTVLVGHREQPIKADLTFSNLLDFVNALANKEAGTNVWRLPQNTNNLE